MTVVFGIDLDTTSSCDFFQLLQSDLLIPQMEVTFSALKRSLVGPNEVTLKNLVVIIILEFLFSPHH